MNGIQNIDETQFTNGLRFVVYFILSFLLFVATFTEFNVELESLFLLPFVFVVLFFDRKLYQKAAYHYGKAGRINAMFLVDTALIALFIAVQHALLLPTVILIAALLFVAYFCRISSLVVMFAPVIGVATFYLATALVFGFENYGQASSTELNILYFIFFMLFMGACLNYQTRRVNILEEEKQHYIEEVNRYVNLNNQLARYAPMQVWQSIMRGELEAKVEYKRRKMTVFFSDIQGFTKLSETLIPDDLAFLLNDYFKHMTEIAKHYGGTIDKFMGDGVLIFFGDPHSRGVKEDAIACLEMAIAMRQQMRILRERWVKMGYTSLHVRMGVATGYCHVGNYGTAHRMSYTILGRDVNLAARLQTAAEVDQILISEETFNLIKEDFLCIKNRPLKLKGLIGLVRSWQVVGRYHESVDKYKRWYDYEFKGFNLLLNLDQTPNYEYPQLIDVMKQTIERLELQQKKTDYEGAVMLKEEDTVDLALDFEHKKTKS